MFSTMLSLVSVLQSSLPPQLPRSIQQLLGLSIDDLLSY